MAKRPIILRERAKTPTPAQTLTALEQQEEIIKNAKKMLDPLRDITILQNMISELQEGRTIQASTMQKVFEELQESRTAQDKTLKSVMASFDKISKAFNKTLTTSVSSNQQASASNNALVSEGIGNVIKATRTDIQSVIKSNQAMTQALTASVQALAEITNKEDKPIHMAAEVTERDTADRIKKIEIRDVNGA